MGNGIPRSSAGTPAADGRSICSDYFYRSRSELLQEDKMTIRIRKLVPVALLVGIFGLQAMALTACNTAEGFGKDVENTGEKLQEGAKDAKQKL